MRNHVIATLFATAVAFAVTPASAAENLSALSSDKSSSWIEILHIYPADEAAFIFDSRNLAGVSFEAAVADERENCELPKS